MKVFEGIVFGALFTIVLVAVIGAAVIAGSKAIERWKMIGALEEGTSIVSCNYTRDGELIDCTILRPEPTLMERAHVENIL